MRRSLLPLLLALLLAGCAPSRDAASGSGPALESASDLVAFLRREGYFVNSSGLSSPTFTSTTGYAYEVPGGTLHVFEYDTENEARSAVGPIGGEASRASQSSVYQRGRLVVAYVGSSLQVEASLRRALGQPYL